MAQALVPPKQGLSPTRLVERALRKQLIGQDRAIREIVRALERAFSGLKNPEHPIAVLAFFGPTGTGKTFAAEVLSRCFAKKVVWRCVRYQECRFEVSEYDLIQARTSPPRFCPAEHSEKTPTERIELPTIWTIDCGEMSGSLEFAVSKLVGSPPGYVGHGTTPPIFTGGRAPYVVLFDEAEKALLSESWRGGNSFANLILKILDKGKIRNNLMQEVDFTNSIIILTGNLGAAEILSEFDRKIGFPTPGSTGRDLSRMTDTEIAQLNRHIYDVVRKKAERELAPEFLNRLDRLIVFQFLTQRDYAQIVRNELAKVQQRIVRAGLRNRVPRFNLTFSPPAISFLIREAMRDRRFGARVLSRILEKRVVTSLSRLVNDRVVQEGDQLQARVGEVQEDGTTEKTIVFFRVAETKRTALEKKD